MVSPGRKNLYRRIFVERLAGEADEHEHHADVDQ